MATLPVLGFLRLRRGPPPVVLAGAGYWNVAAWGSAVAISLGLFFLMPHEAAYLLPAVPFVLLLAARTLGQRWFIVFCGTLVLSSFVLEASEGQKPTTPDFSPVTVRLPVGERSVYLDVVQGPILTDRSRREQGVRYARGLLRAAAGLPGPSVLVAYEWLPVLRVLSWAERHGPAEFVYLLDRSAFDRYRERGYSVYLLPEAIGPNRASHGIDLTALGAQVLDRRIP